MKPGNVYGFMAGAARVGRMNPEKMTPPETGQVDPPEYIEQCRNCPLADCEPDAVECPLNRIELERRAKSGKLGRKTMRKLEYVQALKRQRQMVRSGGTCEWICRELGISKKTYYRRLARIERLVTSGMME